MPEVQTVTGLIPVENLGITLMHEHIFVDRRHLWKKPQEVEDSFAYAPVSLSIVNELKHTPYGNLDNNHYTDLEESSQELDYFKSEGGGSVVDVTIPGIGRDPEKLKQVSENTELPVIMGCGYYLEPTFPPGVKEASKEQIRDWILQDIYEGVGPEKIKAGIIGEIGISPYKTAAEVKVLRGAAMAQRESGRVLTIHMPGWERYGHEVLDIVEEEGGDIDLVILDHMNPSHEDISYQTSLAERGAYLEYDMIGIELLFPEGQSPSDEQSAQAICELLDRGFEKSLLLSQDVFLKSLLRKYGGGGFSHLLRHFVPRLKRMGVSEKEIHTMLENNPQQLFSKASVKV
ncbi:phosphotriesterase family protein [Alkalicoccus halolimnae]|uniref:Phosphotriesterase-related protein n=1 Tax=Alkalicoccus halolimnae TaxID=1667239 RepID=A0A5C7F6V5_9BACI|nr:phosphotriesterase-related protein [Alkalicoccus halolimnae]TXF85310.1 phosphotriesterase-related protein [Alkalicoccus halolimnae]